MIRVGAYEAKTRLSELLDRAEKGEVFEITKNGRPVAKLVALNEDQQEAEARAAANQLLAWLEEAPPVSEAQAQLNWEELKRDMEEEDEERMSRWFSSSTPR